jgi:O-antigen/teichoic acid export membrane protein
LTSTENQTQATALQSTRHRHLAVGTLLATAAQIAPLVAVAGMSLVIARLYGPRGTGVISLVMTLADVVLQIFTIGLSAGITYLLSRREWPLRQAVREISRAATGLGVAGAICGLAFYFAARDTIFRGVSPTLAIIALASLPFALAWTFSAAAALGRDRYEAYAGLLITNALVILIGGIVLALTFGLTGAVAAFAAANVVAAFAGARWSRRELTRAEDGDDAHASSHPLRRATRFGLQAWSANLLQLLNYRLDIFILSSVAPRSAVGIYATAVSVSALGWLLPNALQTVLFPRVASLDAAAGAGTIATESSNAAAARAVRHSVLLMVPTALGIAVLGLLIPLLYGPRFDASVKLCFILIPGVVALGIAKVVSAVISGRGFPRYALYTTLITVPITLVLYFALIPAFHATGAAIASSISYSLTMLLSIIYFRPATRISIAALVPRRSDVHDYVAAVRAARRRFAGA